MEQRAVKQVDLGTLSSAVNYYYDLQQEKYRLELSMKIARESLIEAFKYAGMRVYDTDNGLRARVDTSIRTTISAKEAKELLDEETYRKLAKETASLTVSVRSIKGGGE